MHIYNYYCFYNHITIRNTILYTNSTGTIY